MAKRSQPLALGVATLTGRQLFLEMKARGNAFSEATYYEGVRDLVNDPESTAADVLELILSDLNPCLQPGVVPGSGFVSRTTLESSLWVALVDLLDRKRLEELDAELRVGIEDRFSVPLARAAEQLKIHVSALRQAVHANRIPSWFKDGGHWLRPETVAAFKPERRGPSSAATKRNKKATKARIR